MNNTKENRNVTRKEIFKDFKEIFLKEVLLAIAILIIFFSIFYLILISFDNKKIELNNCENKYRGKLTSFPVNKTTCNCLIECRLEWVGDQESDEDYNYCNMDCFGVKN